MSISSNLTKLTTDITNAYTSIENKGGTIPANKNTDNLHTAIDSIEVIEQATAEGESLSLTNTKAMPYKDYVLKGKSEQATRSGKNLLNVTATTRTMNGVTITVNQDKSITLNGTNTSSETIFYRLADNFNLPAGTYTLSNHNNNVSNNNFIFYDDNYSFEERYNVVTKTFNTQKTIKPYLKVAAGITLNNEIIYPMIEKNSFMTDYEPYGASPSPEYPSEIHSVADDLNLWSLNSSYTTSTGSEYVIRDTTINTIPAGTYTLSLNKSVNSNMFFNFKNSSNQETTIFLNDVESVTMNFTSNIVKCAIYIYGNQACTISNIKIQKGTVATPYSPYNQGTVTIKQRGKNLFNKDNSNILNAYFKSDGEISYGGGSFIDTNYYKIKPNTDYVISGTRIENLCYYDENKNFLERVINLNTDITIINKNATYFRFQTLTDNLNLNTFQIEEGSTATDYEPYQANDYTFQTEPLRSLPNGVKDSKDTKQHRKIGRQTGTLTETTTITLSDAKTNGAYMCNIKPSGTLTGKTIELEAGDYEIIYELETEVIEPLTQNQATTMLDIIKTGSYEGTTNIYTDEDVKPTIKVGYYKKK